MKDREGETESKVGVPGGPTPLQKEEQRNFKMPNDQNLSYFLHFSLPTK